MSSLPILANRTALVRAAAVLALCLGGAAHAQEMPLSQYVVGDSWSYREIDLLTRNETGKFTETVTAVTPTEYWIDARRNARTWWRGDAAKGLHRELLAYSEGAPDNRGKTLANNDGGCAYPWPLKVGMTFDCKDAALMMNGWKVRYELKWTVEAAESVETPAGRFDTLRLVGKGFVDNETTGARPARHERTVWLAPAAKREVKHEIRTFLPNGQIFRVEGRELVSFKAGGS